MSLNSIFTRFQTRNTEYSLTIFNSSSVLFAIHFNSNLTSSIIRNTYSNCLIVTNFNIIGVGRDSRFILSYSEFACSISWQVLIITAVFGFNSVVSCFQSRNSEYCFTIFNWSSVILTVNSNGYITGSIIRNTYSNCLIVTNFNIICI